MATLTTLGATWQKKVGTYFTELVENNLLSPASAELLHRHLRFYESLNYGGRAVTTDAQSNFLRVVVGQREPVSSHELGPRLITLSLIHI